MIIKSIQKFFESKSKSLDGVVEKTESFKHKDTIVQILDSLDLPSSFVIEEGFVFVPNWILERGTKPDSIHYLGGPYKSDDDFLNRIGEEVHIHDFGKNKMLFCISIINYTDNVMSDENGTFNPNNDQNVVSKDYAQKMVEYLKKEKIIIEARQDIFISFMRMWKINSDIHIMDNGREYLIIFM